MALTLGTWGRAESPRESEEHAASLPRPCNESGVWSYCCLSSFRYYHCSRSP